MRTLLIVMSSMLLLTGCGGSSPVLESPGAAYRELTGATLVLNREILVPAGRARVFIQDGGTSAGGHSRVSGSFDHYRPHCGLEVRHVDHAGFTIRPDEFRITRVQGTLQQVVSRAPLRVAGLSLVSGGMDGDGSAAYHEGYHFWLMSATQPEVRRMSCYGTFAEPPDLAPPTLDEIARALGDVAELRY